MRQFEMLDEAMRKKRAEELEVSNGGVGFHSATATQTYSRSLSLAFCLFCLLRTYTCVCFVVLCVFSRP